MVFGHAYGWGDATLPGTCIIFGTVLGTVFGTVFGTVMVVRSVVGQERSSLLVSGLAPAEVDLSAHPGRDCDDNG